MTLKIKLTGIILLLFIAGCIKEKDELTLPVRIHLRICFASETFSMDNYLSLDQAMIGIQRIQFEGKREAGEDVFFETDPNMNLPAFPIYKSGLKTKIYDFDLPQGVYNYMKWDITLKKTDIGINDDKTYSLSIGLFISGFFYYYPDPILWDNSIAPFIIAIDDTEQLSVRAYNQDGNSRIVLSRNKDYDAIIILSPFYAFSSISQQSLEEAISHPNRRYILISSNSNEDLYENLLNQITLSAKVLVK